MGGKTKTSSSIDPTILARQIGVLDRAQAIADQPFSPYSGQRIAPFNPDQLASFERLRDIGQTDPGAGLFSDAEAAARGASAYDPQMVQAQAVRAGRLSDLDLTPYTNRWDDAVVAASNADVERARELQRVQDAAGATTAGAWGGSRHGVTDALTNEAALREAGARSATLRSQGYANAQQLGLADIDRIFAADQGNQSAGLQAALGNQQAHLQGAQLRLAGGSLLGNLAGQRYQQAAARAQLLQGLGDAQQAQTQKGLDFDWEEFIRQQQDPQTKQALLAAAMSGVQAPSTTTEKKLPGLSDYVSDASRLIDAIWGGKGIIR